MLRKNLLSVHRWVSIVFAAFWVIQAATGMIAVFHWEIDDATIPGAHHPTNFSLIEQRIDEYVSASPGRKVSSIWSSAGFADRYDVNISTITSEPSHVLRIDGIGTILRKRTENETLANGGFISLIISLHHNLLGGTLGKLIVGISGIVLLSNLFIGVYFAWPRHGNWRSLLPKADNNLNVAWYHSWHRALGLAFFIPAIFVVFFGVSLAFEKSLSKLLNAPAASHPAPDDSWVNHEVGLRDVVEGALSRYPEAKVAGISFPSSDYPVWKITLNQPEEAARAYGKTRVFLNAADGSVLSDYNTLTAPAGNRFMDALFSIHNGEIGGVIGRIITFSVGLWLLLMITLGIGLWLARRDRARRRPKKG
ncbi:PepSY-associated TM helix domain-containing protein [Hyphococcus lacteus]|uniref:PepSY-associated TM helix domain-containing protein n=1 Tax=Hyphococcus lacteus TaxID=3143536 RepID=A0ABV3ZAY3_9PROT